MRLGVLLLCCSCGRPTPIERCTDDLAGVYEVETTATEQTPTHWNVLDNRRTLEAYPLFDDSLAVADLETAPRVIDLRRISEAALAGEVTRRFLQGARRCDAKANVRVTACGGDTLELVLADPVPPIGFEPCTFGQPAPSRRERWHRVR